MKEEEILELIEFSPNNLQEFFDNSLQVVDKGVPSYGILKGYPIVYALLDSPIVSASEIPLFVYSEEENE